MHNDIAVSPDLGAIGVAFAHPPCGHVGFLLHPKDMLIGRLTGHCKLALVGMLEEKHGAGNDQEKIGYGGNGIDKKSFHSYFL